MRIRVVRLDAIAVIVVLAVPACLSACVPVECDETNIETCCGSNSFLVHNPGRRPAMPIDVKPRLSQSPACPGQPAV